MEFRIPTDLYQHLSRMRPLTSIVFFVVAFAGFAASLPSGGGWDGHSEQRWLDRYPGAGGGYSSLMSRRPGSPPPALARTQPVGGPNILDTLAGNPLGVDAVLTPEETQQVHHALPRYGRVAILNEGQSNLRLMQSILRYEHEFYYVFNDENKHPLHLNFVQQRDGNLLGSRPVSDKVKNSLRKRVRNSPLPDNFLENWNQIYQRSIDRRNSLSSGASSSIPATDEVLEDVSRFGRLHL